MQKNYSRKHQRLKGYNYSSNGSYFITLCTRKRECFFGDIVSGDVTTKGENTNINDEIYQKAMGAVMILTPIGKITEKYIETGKQAYKDLCVDKYVIMPNHIHLIITISNQTAEPAGSPQHNLISKFVSSLKSLITHEIGYSIFQRSYYDHIIRNENEYEKIWNYIDGNISQWVNDRFYMY